MSIGDDIEEGSPSSKTTAGNQLDHKLQSDDAPAQTNDGGNIETTDDAWVTDDPSSTCPGVSFNDESAARGLLALGTASPEKLFDVLDFPDTNQVEALDGRTGDIGSWYQSNGINVSAQLQVLQLLRHYRYEIAPWVCACELELDWLLTLPTVGYPGPSAVVWHCSATNSDLFERLTFSHPVVISVVPHSALSTQ